MKTKVPERYRLSKNLDATVREFYESIGYPSQTLEEYSAFFTEKVISKLYSIIRTAADNIQASYAIEDYMGKFGFTIKGGGQGTNIVVLLNPSYPGVVFKFALDEYGVADNFNDTILQDAIPFCARVLYQHPSGLVSVQERHFVMTKERIGEYADNIRKVLDVLGDYYLLADLSIPNFLNFGIWRDGNFSIIDASDLYPLKRMKNNPLRCTRVTEEKKDGRKKYCKGKLHYDNNYKYLVCEKCGEEILPILLRPRREDVSMMMSSILSDGMTADEREELERYQQERIQAKLAIEKAAKPQEEVTPEPQPEKEPEPQQQQPKKLFARSRSRKMIETLENPVIDEDGEIAVDRDNQEVIASMIKYLDEVQPVAPSDAPDEEEEEEAPIVIFGESFRQKPSRQVVHESTQKIVIHSDYDDEEEEDDDEEEEVEVVDYHAPSSPVPENQYVSLHDDEEEEDEPIDSYDEEPEPEEEVTEHTLLQALGKMIVQYGLVDVIRKNNLTINEVSELIFDAIQSVEEKETEEDEETDPLTSIQTEPDRLEYSIVNYNERSDFMPGIYVDVYGDLDAAFDKCGLPIYVTLESDEEEGERRMSSTPIMLPYEYKQLIVASLGMQEVPPEIEYLDAEEEDGDHPNEEWIRYLERTNLQVPQEPELER